MGAQEWAGRSDAPLRSSSTSIGVKNIHVQFDRGPAAASATHCALMPLDEHLDPNMLDDIRLLVSELVTNNDRHTSDEDDSTVGLEVNLTQDRVRVEVTDRDMSFKPTPRTADR